MGIGSKKKGRRKLELRGGSGRTRGERRNRETIYTGEGKSRTS